MKVIKGLVAAGVLAVWLLGSVNSVGATTAVARYTVHVTGVAVKVAHIALGKAGHQVYGYSVSTTNHDSGYYMVDAATSTTSAMQSNTVNYRQALRDLGSRNMQRQKDGSWFAVNMTLAGCVMEFGTYHNHYAILVTLYNRNVGYCQNTGIILGRLVPAVAKTTL